MPRRLRGVPVRTLALALALAAAAAAGVDTGGEKLPDCRFLTQAAQSSDPGSFPPCSLIKNGEFHTKLRINFAPGGASSPGGSFIIIIITIITIILIITIIIIIITTIIIIITRTADVAAHMSPTG